MPFIFEVPESEAPKNQDQEVLHQSQVFRLYRVPLKPTLARVWKEDEEREGSKFGTEGLQAATLSEPEKIDDILREIQLGLPDRVRMLSM